MHHTEQISKEDVPGALDLCTDFLARKPVGFAPFSLSMPEDGEIERYSD